MSEHIPNAERITVHSTSEAAEKAASETGSAAVCNELCSKLHNLEIVEANIDDKAGKTLHLQTRFTLTDWLSSIKTDNATRFLIIGTGSDTPTNDDHTLLRFTVDHRQHGALGDGLKVFKDFGINLFKIDTRPSPGQQPWHYVFFVECAGHFESEPMQKSIQELHKVFTDVVVIGSFANQRP